MIFILSTPSLISRVISDHPVLTRHCYSKFCKTCNYQISPDEVAEPQKLVNKAGRWICGDYTPHQCFPTLLSSRPTFIAVISCNIRFVRPSMRYDFIEWKQMYSHAIEYYLFSGGGELISFLCVCEMPTPPVTVIDISGHICTPLPWFPCRYSGSVHGRNWNLDEDVSESLPHR